jgi:hypothetical protein
LLQQKKGLIVCSIMMGAHRFIALEAALQGLPVWTPLTESGYKSITAKLHRLKKGLSALARGKYSEYGRYIARALQWNVISQSKPSVGQLLLAALKRNEVVVVFLDWPSAAEDRNNAEMPIQFLGRETRANKVIAELAWQSGAPVLPMAALMRGSEPGAVLNAAPRIASRTERRSAEQSFIIEVTARLYSFLEIHAKTYPEQWAGFGVMHAWRQLAVAERIH